MNDDHRERGKDSAGRGQEDTVPSPQVRSASPIDWLRLLRESDERSLPGRASRLPLVYWDPDPDGWHMFVGGEASLAAYEESRLAYLHGAFLGCILLVQVCLEHMLAGLFRMAGDDNVDRQSYRTVLIRARDESYLSSEEWELFERLRTVRQSLRPHAATDEP